MLRACGPYSGNTGSLPFCYLTLNQCVCKIDSTKFKAPPGPSDMDPPARSTAVSHGQCLPPIFGYCMMSMCFDDRTAKGHILFLRTFKGQEKEKKKVQEPKKKGRERDPNRSPGGDQPLCLRPLSPPLELPYAFLKTRPSKVCPLMLSLLSFSLFSLSVLFPRVCESGTVSGLFFQ